mmetsp:Transcript_29185/g.94139  ORF Transcript_29185/g.94139 Transcript_29185/m.94139 type:complete len:211 (+) Transcript_29185:363-995(+)
MRCVVCAGAGLPREAAGRVGRQDRAVDLQQRRLHRDGLLRYPASPEAPRERRVQRDGGRRRHAPLRVLAVGRQEEGLRRLHVVGVGVHSEPFCDHLRRHEGVHVPVRRVPRRGTPVPGSRRPRRPSVAGRLQLLQRCRAQNRRHGILQENRRHTQRPPQNHLRRRRTRRPPRPGRHRHPHAPLRRPPPLQLPRLPHRLPRTRPPGLRREQ